MPGNSPMPPRKSVGAFIKPTARKRAGAALASIAWSAALALAAPAHAVLVEHVRMHEAPEHTRVVFESSGALRYKVFQLTDPLRVVIDLENATLAKGLDPSKAARGHKRIRTVRSASRARGQRIVLDMAAVFEPRHFTLEPVPPYGHRLVLDLFEQDREARQPTPEPAPSSGQRDVIIAVDAGHGGEDPGAVGAHGIYEKTVVLQMARKLAALFNKTPGYRAVLVRKGDYYIPLRKRMEIARRERADMFLSIHADAFKNPAANGASVYALSQRGATSETARWLAEKDNRSDLIGGEGGSNAISLDDKDDTLAYVLIDISMDGNLRASLEAGEQVLKQLGGVTKLHSDKVGQAGFVVLKSPDIPSLLVETGYISNPREARRLSQADHQNRIVRAIHAGVNAYMLNSPPAGSALASRAAAGKFHYAVERGDTLSKIAERHGTSAAQLRRINGLRGDRIRAGQVILIPVRS